MHHVGSCLCAGVRFAIAGPLEPIEICHCAQCRRAQGGPFASNIPVQTDRFSITEGVELLQAYESSPGKERVFCRRCGSPIFSRRSTLPGVVRLRAGLIAEPVMAHIGFHAYTQSKAGWWPIDDDLPRYPQAFTP